MNPTVPQELKDANAHKNIQATLVALREAKPAERSELARRYAVTLTEMEKIEAYFLVYVVGADGAGVTR